MDNNNNNRQGQLPFEESYCSKRWDLRQFGFVIALAMTNAQLAYNYFVKFKEGEEVMTKAEFQRELASELVFNSDIATQESDGEEGMVLRIRKRLPEGCRWAFKSNNTSRAGHELVRIDKGRGRWNGKEFPKIKTKYSKCACSYGCGATT